MRFALALAAMLLLLQAPAAVAYSGSITDVHDAGGGRISATYSTVWTMGDCDTSGRDGVPHRV